MRRGKQKWESDYSDAVEAAFSHELRLHKFLRAQTWLVVYESPKATLHLQLSDPPCWKLFAKADRALPNNSPLREALRRPVARATCSSDTKNYGDDPFALDSWQTLAPRPTVSKVLLKSAPGNERLPSWRSSIGLLDFEDETVPKRLIVSRAKATSSSPSSSSSQAAINAIEGEYEQLPNCATAFRSLYARVSPANDSPMYLFADPTNVGPPEEDGFVFSTQHGKLQDGQIRETLASIEPSWRPWNDDESKPVNLSDHGYWVDMKHGRVQTRLENADTTFSVAIPPALSSSRSAWPNTSQLSDCNQALTVLRCEFDTPSHISVSQGTHRIAADDTAFFKTFDFALGVLRSYVDLSTWRSLEAASEVDECGCAPVRPSIKWFFQKSSGGGGRSAPEAAAIEDHIEAGRFERSLKNRPAIFAIDAAVAESVELRIGVNPHSLAHRAIGDLNGASAAGTTNLTSSSRSSTSTSTSESRRIGSRGRRSTTGTEAERTEDVQLSWRLDTFHSPYAAPTLKKFHLQSNITDEPYALRDLQMLLPLKEEQLRSLTWMLHRENPLSAPFLAQEIAEEVHEALGWRAEVRARKPIHVRGGISADAVSYGKTVITLALVQAELKATNGIEGLLQDNASANAKAKAQPDHRRTAGLIDIPATIIVAPRHLAAQWRSEVRRFLPEDEFPDAQVLSISTFEDLKRYRIRDFLNAKIVILAWDVICSDKYVASFATLTAMPEPAGTKGRSFPAWLDYAAGRIPSLIEKLRADGLEAFKEHLNALAVETQEHPDFSAAVPSKRLRGAAYLKATAGDNDARRINNKSNTTTGSDDVSDELPSSSTATRTKRGPSSAGKKSATTTTTTATAADHRDWANLKGPLLHYFRFNRLVLDEFSYLEGGNFPVYSSILRLSAVKRWALSGTPPLDDFADVKRMANFIGVNLGIDNATPGVIKKANISRLRSEQTKTEEFLSFKDYKSADWHQERHAHAQAFLDHFVRQNDALVEKIPCEEILVPVVLQPDHYAIYMELSQHFNSRDMRIVKGGKKSDADKENARARVAVGIEDARGCSDQV